jgi:hypothetical protein
LISPPAPNSATCRVLSATPSSQVI